MAGLKKAVRTLAMGCLLAVLATGAQAAERGGLGYGGPGCPSGSVSLSGSGSTLNLRLSAFQAASGTGRRFDRKACSLAIPINVPKNKALSSVAVRFRGASRLPVGAKASLRSEMFAAGRAGTVRTRNLAGPKTGSFSFAATIPVSSACGRDVTLRANSSLRVSTPSGARASIAVDGMTIQLRWRSC